jgi:hypothetical protein
MKSMLAELILKRGSPKTPARVTFMQVERSGLLSQD